MYRVRAIKIGKLHAPSATIKHIEVPAASEREAMVKAEVRLGAKWGVVSAVLK